MAIRIFIIIISLTFKSFSSFTVDNFKSNTAELLKSDTGTSISQKNPWHPIIEIPKDKLPNGKIELKVKYRGGPIQAKNKNGSSQEGLAWSYDSPKEFTWKTLYFGKSDLIHDSILIVRAGNKYPVTEVSEIEIIEKNGPLDLSSAPGWTPSNWMQRRKSYHTNNFKENSIIFLGDSITRGFDLDFHFNNYKTINQGISGDLSLNMLIRLEEDVLPLKPETIVIMAGTNDLKDGHSISQISKRIFKIVDKARVYTNGTKIVLCTLMPRHEPHLRDKVMNLNNILLKESIKRPWLKICNPFKELSDPNGLSNNNYFPDGVHPNNSGYEIWKNKLLPILEL